MYNEAERIARGAILTAPDAVGKTEQNHKDACDVNRIIKRYKQSGIWHRAGGQHLYGDFTNVNDYMTCINSVMQAQNDFMLLPAALRERFNNDVAKVIEFLSDEKNKDEAIRLGIIPKPKEVLEGQANVTEQKVEEGSEVKNEV